jgi:hypothetical protein
MNWILACLLWCAPWGTSTGLPPRPMKPMPEMRIINEDRPGLILDLASELSPGKYNVVDFFADW